MGVCRTAPPSAEADDGAFFVGGGGMAYDESEEPAVREQRRSLPWRHH